MNQGYLITNRSQTKFYEDPGVTTQDREHARVYLTLSSAFKKARKLSAEFSSYWTVTPYRLENKKPKQ